jgi:hypothetical protein
MVDGLRHRPCTKSNNKDCPAFGMYFKGKQVVFNCKVKGELVKTNAKDKGSTYDFPLSIASTFIYLFLMVFVVIGARPRTAITCLLPILTRVAPNTFQRAKSNRPHLRHRAIHPAPFRLQVR